MSTTIYDRKRVDFSISTLSMAKIIQKFEEKEFSFIEKEFIWDFKEQSSYIEFILLGMPLNPLYFDYSNGNQAFIFDGKERYNSIQKFLDDKLPLTKVKYYPEFEGLFFSQIPRALQRKIEDSLVLCHFINPGVPRNIAADLMERICSPHSY